MPSSKNSQSQNTKLTSWVSNHTPQAASSAEEKQNHAWRKTEEITQIVSEEWAWNVFSSVQALFLKNANATGCFYFLLGFMFTYCISRGCSEKEEINLNNALYFLVRWILCLFELNWSLAMGPRWVTSFDRGVPVTHECSCASWVTHYGKQSFFTGKMWFVCTTELLRIRTPTCCSLRAHWRAGQEPSKAPIVSKQA